jgi:cytohesin
VIEMLQTRAAAAAALRWYLEFETTEVQLVMRLSLRECERRYHAALERSLPAVGARRAAAAVGLCRALGLLEESAAETDAEGLTPLMRAAADGAGRRALRCLAAAGADVNARDAGRGRTALYLAASCGHAAAVEDLVALGADANIASDRGFTPMIIAAQEGHAEVVAALARLGADVDRADASGCTPVWRAAQKGHTAVIEALARAGADVNRADGDGWTPVFNAAQFGQVSAIEALAGLGADVRRAADDGVTPLQTATRNGHEAAAAALRRLGAE